MNFERILASTEVLGHPPEIQHAIHFLTDLEFSLHGVFGRTLFDRITCNDSGLTGVRAIENSGQKIVHFPLIFIYRYVTLLYFLEGSFNERKYIKNIGDGDWHSDMPAWKHAEAEARPFLEPFNTLYGRSANIDEISELLYVLKSQGEEERRGRWKSVCEEGLTFLVLHELTHFRYHWRMQGELARLKSRDAERWRRLRRSTEVHADLNATVYYLQNIRPNLRRFRGVVTSFQVSTLDELDFCRRKATALFSGLVTVFSLMAPHVRSITKYDGTEYLHPQMRLVTLTNLFAWNLKSQLDLPASSIDEIRGSVREACVHAISGFYIEQVRSAARIGGDDVQKVLNSSRMSTPMSTSPLAFARAEDRSRAAFREMRCHLKDDGGFSVIPLEKYPTECVYTYPAMIAAMLAVPDNPDALNELCERSTTHFDD